jgi:sugar lactone lactonase YvrE
VKTLISGRGTLESAIVDRRGHLFFTDQTAGQLLRVGHPGGKPKVLVSGIESPGGLAFDSTGKLVVGYGDFIPSALTGLLNPQAGLLSVDPRTGAHSLLFAGTQMSNGIAIGPDGTIYASADVGLGIDRVKDGTVKLNWTHVFSPNGLAVDGAGKWLYANQTFTSSRISRISIADPSHVELYARPPASDFDAGLDGMDRGRGGRLYVAANEGGELWRVDRDRTICAVARGLKQPSAVALGHGKRGFSWHNLYAVTFSGDLVEVPGVR